MLRRMVCPWTPHCWRTVSSSSSQSPHPHQLQMAPLVPHNQRAPELSRRAGSTRRTSAVSSSRTSCTSEGSVTCTYQEKRTLQNHGHPVRTPSAWHAAQLQRKVQRNGVVLDMSDLGQPDGQKRIRCKSSWWLPTHHGLLTGIACPFTCSLLSALSLAPFLVGVPFSLLVAPPLPLCRWSFRIFLGLLQTSAVVGPVSCHVRSFFHINALHQIKNQQTFNNCDVEFILLIVH